MDRDTEIANRIARHDLPAEMYDAIGRALRHGASELRDGRFSIEGIHAGNRGSKLIFTVEVLMDSGESSVYNVSGNLNDVGSVR